MEIGIPASEAKKQRRQNIVAALGRERRLTVLEAKALRDELEDYLAEDPEHDPALHLGKKTLEEAATMAFCPQCEAQTHLQAMRTYFAARE